MSAIYTIPEIKNIVCPLAKEYGAERVYLFGSYARGESTKNSDIDLRIDKGNIKGLAGKLSDDFRHENNQIPWQQIKATRNIVAHSYGSVDPVVTWEIITGDIPTLKDYCQAIVNAEQQI